jgi:hypothetical protein
MARGKTYNATPSFAYQLNNWLSIGAGVQIERGGPIFRVVFPSTTQETPPWPWAISSTSTATAGGFGFTASVTLTPPPTTTIGLGYRSAINQKINGTLTLPPGGLFTTGGGSTPGSVNATLNLPDIVSLGIRQRVNPQLTLLGTVEWTNWSRIGTTAINQPSGAPATIVGNAVKLPFQYKDGWFFSAGAEYQWNEKLAVRGGVGQSVVQPGGSHYLHRRCVIACRHHLGGDEVSLGQSGAGTDVDALPQIANRLLRREKAGGDAGLFRCGPACSLSQPNSGLPELGI